MTPAKERLVRDLAEQAGLVLRNVRLIEELRSSRQRLVAAQDEEQGGAQQHEAPAARELRNRGMGLLDQLTPVKRWLVGRALDV